MLIVLPFCEKDHGLAIKLLNWVGELDGNTGHPCVLIASKACPKQKQDSVYAAAQGKFQTVDMVSPGVEDERPWPMATNTLFRAACKYAEKQTKPWLWLEPDCVPIRSGWASLIEREHLTNRKLFTGGYFPHPIPHLNGVAVYPAKIPFWTSRMLSPGAVAFDLICAEAVLRHAHVTTLIQRSLAVPETNTPHTFPEGADWKTIVNPWTVLFHGCKDGSLIARLYRQKRSGLYFKVHTGEKTLADWLPRSKAVSSALSEQRAITCSACPKNSENVPEHKGNFLNLFPEFTARLVRRQFQERKDMNLSTTSDSHLGTCLACKFPIALVVHVPVDSIRKHGSDASLHSDCWIKKETLKITP